MSLIEVMLPELVLIGTACILFMLGMSSRSTARLASPWLALLALLGAFVLQVMHYGTPQIDEYGTFRIHNFAHFIKLIASGIGILFVLLAWPDNKEGTGNSALDYGHEAGEFFALMLLSIAGVLLVAGANDLVLLFLGLELASIPTYIMVSVSRPLPAAQEAGVKYFFLGAMSAALMLFGFSYLYGVTGTTNLYEISSYFIQLLQLDGLQATGAFTAWQLLALILLIAGFAFKMAVVPLHFYAGDVYQGAATPVTALLSFVPKASGLVALLKILFAVGGGGNLLWQVPPEVVRLMWVLAVLTMTVGNVLALLQSNVKRVLAYSSVAHSGYLLVGVTALLMGDTGVKLAAMEGILFYLVAYGIMNAAAFGVLMLLPARQPRPATSAETFEDLAGQGRHYPGLGLAMAVCCFSLTGLPLTIGFFGKFLLLRPAFQAGAYGLVIITVINAAISAGYYLRIVGTMFLRPEPASPTGGAYDAPAPAAVAPPQNMAVTIAIGLSVGGTLLFGTLPPATQLLHNTTTEASNIEPTMPMPFLRFDGDDEDEETTSPMTNLPPEVQTLLEAYQAQQPANAASPAATPPPVAADPLDASAN
jgi:NADH-quinone oxidoreductase subunit N